MKAAIGDAAVMAAMERNSDIIVMQCYAPLFANVNPGAWQWRPNLIGYDALQSYGSPSDYAFQMFSRNRGDEILKTVTTDTTLQVSATRESKSGEIILKLVNPQDAAQTAKTELKGIASVAPSATAITLAAKPKETTVDNIRTSFNCTVPANGIVVLKLKQG
jgi:alpha-N-arabinofuranosidase